MGGVVLRRQVEVGDLAAGVHPCIGPAGHRQLGGRVQAKHHGDPVLQFALHRPEITLGRPTVEGGPVVCQVDPPPPRFAHGNLR